MANKDDSGTPRRSLSPVLDIEKIKKRVREELDANYENVKLSISEVEDENVRLKNEILSLKTLLYNETFRAREFEEKYSIIRYQKLDLQNQMKSVEDEYDQLLSVSVVKGNLEDIELEFSLVLPFPEKSRMIKELEYAGCWIRGNHQKFSLNQVASLHYVRWLYHLQFCTKGIGVEIGRKLQAKGIQIDMFCILVALIYSKTSGRIHNVNRSLTTDKIKKGLIFYGINDDRILDAVCILCEIRTVPLSALSSSNVCTPTSSRHSTPLLPQTHSSQPSQGSNVYTPTSSRHSSPQSMRSFKQTQSQQQYPQQSYPYRPPLVYPQPQLHHQNTVPRYSRRSHPYYNLNRYAYQSNYRRP